MTKQQCVRNKKHFSFLVRGFYFVFLSNSVSEYWILRPQLPQTHIPHTGWRLFVFHKLLNPEVEGNTGRHCSHLNVAIYFPQLHWSQCLRQFEMFSYPSRIQLSLALQCKANEGLMTELANTQWLFHPTWQFYWKSWHQWHSPMLRVTFVCF